MNAGSAEKLRVVLDTNVYISAFTNQKGRPFRIWRAALESRYILITSPPIVDELAGVLRERFGWDDAHITSRLKLLVKVQ